ncbi:hypothetical protein YC2023_106674 [Brassica napus]
MPLKVLGKARDLYMRSITGCAARTHYSSAGAVSVPFPRSRSTSSAFSSTTSSRRMSSDFTFDDDYSELVRAASVRSLGHKNEIDMIRHQQLQQRQENLMKRFTKLRNSMENSRNNNGEILVSVKVRSCQEQERNLTRFGRGYGHSEGRKPTIANKLSEKWVRLEGMFSLPSLPERVVFYVEGPSPGINLLIQSVTIHLESEPEIVPQSGKAFAAATERTQNWNGPPRGTDILLNSLTVKHAEKIPLSPRPPLENPAFGVNILTNSQLTDGTTNGWFPLGNCTLSVAEGSPRILPPMARDSLGPHEPLSGRYMLNVNVALGIDSQWVNGGQVEIKDDKWHEIGGSFRVEKQPSKALVYIQGPSSGVDLMVAGLQIFPVDRLARIKHLRRQTDKIRRSDVILKFSGADASKLSGATVKVRQTRNSFPVGTCISRSSIDNEDFVDFFLKNFNWAVFGNELKWYWTEPEQGKLNYQDADDMLNLCSSNNIETRGHCIFWEVQATVQQWIQKMNQNDLNTAVQNRLTGLLNRYKGKFKHYDVNNEMLHGSFYQDKLGKDIRVNMFKTAHQLDPSATLFVNDYHIEDGCDPKSCPEKYIEHILDLQEKGAPVGGIGIQGHIDSPIGPIVCSALDRLGILGLPIWFTELDVSSINDHIRGDDLEVMMWEAFGHPAVEGIMLWGFWELFMSRDNSHLVNAEGDVNEAGKRLLAVKKDWLSHANGHIDQNGAFAFRGYHGNYAVEVITSSSQKVLKTFVVEKGDSAQVITVDLQGL